MFISVKSNAHDARAYTYTYSGDEPVNPGDMVVVHTPQGRKVVTVSAIDRPKPSFNCKPVVAIMVEKECKQ